MHELGNRSTSRLAEHHARGHASRHNCQVAHRHGDTSRRLGSRIIALARQRLGNSLFLRDNMAGAEVVDLTSLLELPETIDLTGPSQSFASKRRRRTTGSDAPLPAAAGAKGGAGAAASAAPVDVRALLSCPICWENYVTKGAFVTVCGHLAHEECLRRWCDKATAASTSAPCCPKCMVQLPAPPLQRFHAIFLT